MHAGSHHYAYDTQKMADMSFIALGMYSCLLLLYVSYVGINHLLDDSNFVQTYYTSSKGTYIPYDRGYVLNLPNCTRAKRYIMRWKPQLRLLTNVKRSKASTNYYKNSSATFRPIIQLMHDVELNPGSDVQLDIRCLYTKARSVVNKMDKLQALAVDVDIIAVTETWLKPTILSSEILPSSDFTIH